MLSLFGIVGGYISLFSFWNVVNISNNHGALRKYDFHITNDEDITNMRKDWISTFYISTKTTTNPKSVETYSYDEQVNIKTQINVNFIFQFFCALQDLIGAIGGYLGLFLGWSALSLVTAAPSWVKLVQQFMYQKMCRLQIK